MNMNEEFITLLAAAVVCIRLKTRNPRSKWQKKWLAKRRKFTHVNLLSELSLEPSDWRNYLRMDEPTYHALLKEVTPLIEKRDTNMRQAISPHERLTATLRYLVSGCTYEELKFVTAISPQALGTIIPETCRAILRCLQGYMKMPHTEEEWRTIARRFEDRWQFPHCLGAIDGKHIRIVPPPGSGSYFWNYKCFHSMVLIACANADYEFIWCEVGTNGRVSDGGALKNTAFFDKLNMGQLNIPHPEPCSGSVTSLPYVFVGDGAFALRSDFLKPYGDTTLTRDRRIYNYRLSRARRIVENIFGIVANRFRIFHSSINLSLDRIDVVVLTCCILHNFLRKTCPTYTVEELEFEEGMSPAEMLTPLQTTASRNAPTSAKLARELFKEYFVGDGEVPWQDERI